MLDNFIHYWDSIPSAHRVVILLGGMVFFWLLEGYYPLFRFQYRRYRHAGINLVFLAMTLVFNLIFGYTTVLVCQWTGQNGFGLLNWLTWPTWVEVIIALYLGDLFGQYIPHLLMHKVPWMFRFHMIHHSDTHVDVTTGTRHHPVEWVFRESSMILGIFLMGMPMGYYFLYRSLAGIFTHFNHANVRVPEWLDRPISWVFVSPNMHKVHHHYKQPLTDTNYANIFSLWDRLFCTFAYEDTRKLRYGLDILDDSLDEDLGYQFKLPFIYKKEEGLKWRKKNEDDKSH
jgi:sterol desaturase/sphingolipid hydroxylase (fatty acid hydroxylase superfamily)